METPLDCFPLGSHFLFSNDVHLLTSLMVSPPFVLVAHCWNMHGDFSCSLAKYWNRGFVTLQTAIDAAIIQVRKVLIIHVNSFHRYRDLGER